MTRNGTQLVCLVINKLTAFVRKFILFSITTKTGKQNVGRAKKELSITDKILTAGSRCKKTKTYFPLEVQNVIFLKFGSNKHFGKE